MKKKIVIVFLFVLPALMNCQNLENTESADMGIESIAFDRKAQPD